MGAYIGIFGDSIGVYRVWYSDNENMENGMEASFLNACTGRLVMNGRSGRSKTPGCRWSLSRT